MSFMKRLMIMSVLLYFSVMCAVAQTELTISECFSKESFTLGSSTLAYRKAKIGDVSGSHPMLVLYLHGGTSRGSDNEAQLNEKAVGIIYQYLVSHHLTAVMLVPQCPSDGGWTNQLRRVVNEMVKLNIADENCDADRIYVMGGSMGGTGTWTQLSYFPNFYAAALPVAGNPTGLDAANVATTPVLTVMGTADRIMNISAVEEFKLQVLDAGGTFILETVAGWTHENTCEQSYTDTRLDWLFTQTKGQLNRIDFPFAVEDKDNKIYDLSGRRASGYVHGVYISHGKKTIVR